MAANLAAVPRSRARLPVLLGVICVWAGAVPALAQTADAPLYRTFFGVSPRLTVWVVAELHLLFAAFVLGVPVFALIVEVVGYLQKDPAAKRRYDALAYEFTKLLSAAFATTAAFGGLLAFILFSTYPGFMRHLTGTFHKSFYVYGLLFFAETFTLYIYYYGWHRLSQGRAKKLHILLGVLLNLVGTTLMLIANAWTTYMMSPPGLEPGAAGTLATHWQGTSYIGPAWEAFANPLWMPLNIHRLLANVAFGGAICGAYAAVKFLGARDEKSRAHYDWMGYVGNFIAISALIPLPFAGYWLGREIYSFNATMGQDMMGGTFSWTFILQAVFVGSLFVAGNYYLWCGMRRIPGGERYEKYVPYMVAVLFLCFAVWLTPHNLPAGGLEKKFGLMPAKNAVIQLMILTTYVGFLMYRRSNKKSAVSIRGSGTGGSVAIAVAAVLSIATLAWYAGTTDLSDENPAIGQFAVESLPVAFLHVDLGGSITYAATLRWTLYHQMLWIVIVCFLTLKDRGQLGQSLLVSITVFHATLWLFQHGFTIMEKANPLLRQVAVCQVLMVLSCLIVATVIDILLYRGAEGLGPIRWGRMHRRSQFALLLLCVVFVMNMGLMGFIRSGLRKGWHVVAVLKDTSEWSATPSNFTMALVVSGITLTFLLLVTFVFWIASLVEPADTRQQLATTELAEGDSHGS